MSPKEKAEELFNKYATYAVMWTGGIEVEKQNCKQCAIIAVDEIIKEYGTYYKIEVDGKYVSYWEEVKQEINKL